MTNLLSDKERLALQLTVQLANLLHEIIFDESKIGGSVAEFDWNETATHIHVVQHLIMSQAAARAYPEDFRLLGDSFKDPPSPS